MHANTIKPSKVFNGGGLTKGLLASPKFNKTMEKIEAKPFINHAKRVMQTDITKTFLACANIASWNIALSQPFNPEDIPDILEGWRGPSSLDMWGAESDDYQFYRSWEGVVTIPKNQGGKFAWYKAGQPKIETTYPFPKTLNDFLSDLARAGITAHFKPEWITKNALK